MVHDLKLLREPNGGAGSQRLVGAGVGLGKPGIELDLEVDVVGEPPAGSKLVSA
jgi:hypothetical protein